MDKGKDRKKQEEKIFPAIVVKVINKYKVVINRGLRHDVKEGQRFLIYRLSSEEIIDPLSGESLGHLEIVKGTGKVIHVQKRMSTIESDKREPSERKIVRKLSPFASLMESEEETIVPASHPVPFEHPKIKDKAKPI